MKTINALWCQYCLTCLLAGIAGAALAQETEADKSLGLGETDRLPVLQVIGSPEAAATLPGSGAYLEQDAINQQSYDDINRVLRRVPGVYVREEDGYGLFPNISLRGVDSGRSGKVMLLEDGIPMAPAPYSAPAAYYSPTTGRMSGLEVLKGSSQVRYGPQITGGVINYLSTPIPYERSGYVKLLYGDDQELRTHSWYGDTVDTDAGRFGYLAEVYYRRTDGFKTIDAAPGVDRDATGFDNRDFNIKLSWEPNTDRYQRFELKLGNTELDADETYLGLSDTDFDADPNRRYAASRFDNIERQQDRLSLTHLVELTDDTDLASAVYYNEFSRNWFKLAGVNGNDAAEAIAAGGGDFDTLRGDAAGTLEYRANARDYYSAGVKSVITHRFATGNVEHELQAGVRLHQDEIDRFQQDTIYSQNDAGAITGLTREPEGEGGDRVQTTRALAVHVDDTMQIGRLSITPGIRLEHLDLEYEQDQRRADGGGSPDREDGTLNVVAGGIGLNWQQNANWSFFGGVFRGFSTPAPRSHLRSDLDEETSLSSELGIRYASVDRSLRGELVAFNTDFDDLIAQPNLGAGTASDADNVGEVRSRGLELSTEWDPGLGNGWALKTPLFLAFTYTDSEIRNASTSTDPESIFSGAEQGNKLPYIPEVQFSVGAGLEGERWSAHLVGTYVDDTFATASNTSRQVAPDGTPDARYGKTDDYFAVDVSVDYAVNDTLTVLGGVQNLFDDEYIVSRVPLGARPGKPRFLYAGFEASFD